MCTAVEPNQIDALANAVVQRSKESGAVQEQVPGRDERRRNRFKVHRRVVWSLIFLLFGVYLAKPEVQEAHQELHDGTPWMKKGMAILEDWWVPPKKKRKKNSKGRDPSTRKRNSQGKDPRNLEESSKGGNVGTRQTPSQRKDPRTFEAPVKRWRVQKK